MNNSVNSIMSRIGQCSTIKLSLLPQDMKSMLLIFTFQVMVKLLQVVWFHFILLFPIFLGCAYFFCGRHPIFSGVFSWPEQNAVCKELLLQIFFEDSAPVNCLILDTFKVFPTSGSHTTYCFANIQLNM